MEKKKKKEKSNNSSNNQINEESVRENKEKAFQKLSLLFESYISDPLTLKKANNLSYWINLYSTYLIEENTFDPTLLKSYNYGDVIKVNFGYNIGSEEGGLHYCIVLDKKNRLNSKIITVIPLTSVKLGKSIHPSSVFLGDEIYLNLKAQANSLDINLKERASKLFVSNKKVDPKSNSDEIDKLLEDFRFLNKLNHEIEKMKKGSIALISQITTVSKQKIYCPKKNNDLLSDLKISDESLILICNKLKKLFLKNFE